MQLYEAFSVKPTLLEGKELPQKVLLRGIWPICNIDEINHNKRVYERQVWETVMSKPAYVEKMNNGMILGDAEHPEDKTAVRLNPFISHRINKIWIDEKDNRVYAEIDVLDTPGGKLIEALILSGSKVGMSTRAEGELEEAVNEKWGTYQRVIPESYVFETVDFTANPSTFRALPIKVDRNITNIVREGYQNGELNKDAALNILEGLRSKQANLLYESIVGDQDMKNKDKKIKEDAEKEELENPEETIPETLPEPVQTEIPGTGEIPPAAPIELPQPESEVKVEVDATVDKAVEILQNAAAMVGKADEIVKSSEPAPVPAEPVMPPVVEPPVVEPTPEAPVETPEEEVVEAIKEGLEPLPQPDGTPEHEGAETPEQEAAEHAEGQEATEDAEVDREAMFAKEKAEHPWLADALVNQIVEDHIKNGSEDVILKKSEEPISPDVPAPETPESEGPMEESQLQQKFGQLRNEFIKETQEAEKVRESLRKANEEKAVLEAKVSKLQEMKQLAEKKLAESVKKVFKFEADIKSLKESQNAEFIKRYANALVRNSGFDFSKNSLTLLESCKTEEEVNSLFVQIKQGLVESTLHSDVVTEVVINETKKSSNDKEVSPITERIGSVMRSL